MDGAKKGQLCAMDARMEWGQENITWWKGLGIGLAGRVGMRTSYFPVQVAIFYI